MSLKENLEAIKTELSSEEKFFESAVRTERFVKKYQKPMIASLVALLIGLGTYAGYDAYQNAKIEKANKALSALLLNSNDSASLQQLQENSTSLYDLYRLSKVLKEGDQKGLESLKNSNSSEVADIAMYESAVLANDNKALSLYTKKQGALYQDLAAIEVAVEEIQNQNSVTARTSLAVIKEDSALYPLAQMLNHYGVK